MDNSIKQLKDLSSGQAHDSSHSLLEQFKNGVADYWYHIKLFNRNSRLYLLGSFLIGLNFNVFQLLLNLYLKDLGFVENQIGFVLSARAVGMTLIAIPAAFILSRVKLKPILLSSCVTLAIFSYFICSVNTLELMIGFMVLNGMSFAFYRVAAGPFYMRNSTEKERTYLFSLNFAMMILAGMVGSGISGKMVTVVTDLTGDIILGYKYTMYGGIVMGLLAMIPFFMIKAAKPSAEENRINLSREQLKRRGKFYLKIIAVNFFVGSGAGLIIPFLNLYFRDRFKLGPDTIGYYFFFVSLAMVLGSAAAPVLAKRFGLVRTVVFTQLASIPFLLVLSYSYIVALSFFAFVFRAGLMNMGSPIVTNLSLELSEKSEHGLVNALLMVSWTSSWMLSTAIGGSLIHHFGYTITMDITVVLYLMSTLVFFRFFRSAETKTDSSPRWVVNRESLT